MVKIMTIFSLKNTLIPILGGLFWTVTLPAAAALAPNEVTELLADDAAIDDRFGHTVSIDGDTALIGALGSPPVDMGSAYVFVYDGSKWIQQARLEPDGGSVRGFGASVSLDGDTALIGAKLSDSVYVFVRNGTTWTQQATLLADDGDSDQRFGTSVSLDQDSALIGANQDSGNTPESGSAYVFVRNDTTWTQQAKLLTDDGDTGDQFGYSVSIDDELALIGARTQDGGGEQSGAAYVFEREAGSWTQQAKLLAEDATRNQRFGESVSLDGESALIGMSEVAGAAYVFIRIDDTWTQQAKLVASGDFFGNSVSIDGNRALIGAIEDDDNGRDSGSAYVFVRNESAWTQESKIVPGNAVSGDNFGASVSLDGSTALIGAPNSFLEPRSGTAYVYDLAATGDGDGTPSTPPGFRYAVYSETAAELFWNRSTDDGRVVGYEITRNGTLVETRDASSYFDDSLSTGITYTYVIVAVDNDDNRSLPQSVSFMTRGDSDLSENPSTPSGFRYAVYSQTAAELFWNLSSDDGRVVGYEIRRNGVLVETRDATSYFDNSLVPGMTYTYTIVAVDDNGNRSASRSVSF